MQTPPTQGLIAVDWAIISLYIGGMIALGWYYSRRQKSAAEYFVGNAAMNPVLVGVSLFATLLSTVTYLSIPGETIGKGPLILAWILGFPIAYLVVGYGLVPVYMRHRVTSAYELLEAKLGLSVRLLGALLFIMLRVVWMSVLMYIASSAMAEMFGVPIDQRESWTLGIVAVTGIVSIIYTSLGGLRAVVITDVAQSILLLGGALAVVATVTWSMQGVSWFPTSWQEGWDRQPLFSTDPTVRVTLFGTIIFSAVWNICTAGGDQVSVQRFMATRDARAARSAYGVSLLSATVVFTILATVGLALLGYFQARPSLLPAGFDLSHNADQVFPRYIAFHLPPGVSGLVVAGMLAAAMSSLDSGVNSIAAVVSSDWLERLGYRFASQRQRILAMRLLTVAVGLSVVTISLFVGRIESNFLELVQRTANLVAPSIFALFVFALFIPVANAPGVFIGTFFGVAAAVLVGFSESLLNYPISFQWIGITSLLVNLTTGTAASLLLSPILSGGDENAS